jgi:hypothetical protein
MPLIGTAGSKKSPAKGGRGSQTGNSSVPKIQGGGGKSKLGD